MPNFQNQQNSINNNVNNGWNTAFMDAINVVSFLIGLQNLELNITAADLDEYSKKILDEIHAHLAIQDEHLSKQDEHLVIQDNRIDRIESLLAGTFGIIGKE